MAVDIQIILCLALIALAVGLTHQTIGIFIRHTSVVQRQALGIFIIQKDEIVQAFGALVEGDVFGQIHAIGNQRTLANVSVTP